MSNSKFTLEDISNGLKLLEKKFTRISFLIEMVDHYYQPGQFLITHRTTGLSMMLSELAFHIYGQLGRYCFDESHGGYLNISISEIYKQIKDLAVKFPPQGIAHKEEFEKVYNDLDSLKTKYQEKFRNFSDKYYAHLEIRATEEDGSQLDHDNIRADWRDVQSIVAKSKEILNIMLFFWFDRDSNFESGHYPRVARDFWELFDLPENGSNPSDWRWHRRTAPPS